MVGVEYKVRLESFEGPLDLLLFLIRRAEVDIHDIPIAEITDQYLRHLEDLSRPDAGTGTGGRIDIENAGEFLVMAASLLEIKSRMLAPVRPGPGEGGEGVDQAAATPIDPRADLVRQLLEYKRFRDATTRLDEYRREWDLRFPAGSVGSPEAPPDTAAGEEIVALDDIELVDLVEAFARIIETVDLSRVGEHHVLLDDTPIEVHADELVRVLSQRAVGSDGADSPGEVEFSEIFRSRSRSELIGLFLAMLELVRQRRIGVRQEAGRGRVFLSLGPEPEPSQASTFGDLRA